MRLLDTNVLVKWGDPAAKDAVVPYLQDHASEPFVTSTLVLFEFFRPAKRRDNRQEVSSWLGRGLDDIRSFGEVAAFRAASIEASLRSQDCSLPVRDLLIAAHADALDATFVTCDKRAFQSRPVQQLLDVDVITR